MVKQLSLNSYRRDLSTYVGNLNTRAKILLGFSVPLSLLIIIATVFFFSIGELTGTSKWVKHTQQVISDGKELEKLMIDMENGERGFLITGKDNFLEPFIASQNAWDAKIQALQTLVRDNPPQVEKLKEIDVLEKRWLIEAASVEIKKRRSVKESNKSLEYMQYVLRKGQGKNILDEIRGTIEELNQIFEQANYPLGVNALLAIAKDIVDQESGQRGFLITGEENFLEPFHLGKKNFDVHMDNLRQLIESHFEDDEMLTQILNLEALSLSWMTLEAEPEILLRQAVNDGSKNHTDIENALASSAGANILDKIKAQLFELTYQFEKANHPAGKNLVGQISMDLVEQESHQRGFLITGKSEFLTPYKEAREQITTRILALKKVVNNSLNKQLVFAKIDKVQSLSTLWHTEAAAPEIEARREINKSGLSTLKFLEGVLNRNTGKAILDQQRSILDNLTAFFISKNDLKGENYVLKLAKAVVDQETGERGFLITGTDSYLAPYRQGQQDFEQAIIDLLVYIDVKAANTNTNTNTKDYNDHKLLKEDILKLRNGHRQWTEQAAKPEIAARRNIDSQNVNSLEFLQKTLSQEKGKNILDEMRSIIATLEVSFKDTNFTASKHLLTISKAIVDRETGQRGFLITGEDSFLEPYYRGQVILRNTFPKLQSVISSGFDTQNVQEKLDNIEQFANRYQASALAEIALRKQMDENGSSFHPIEQVVASGRGKGILGKTRRLLQNLKATFVQGQNEAAQYLVTRIEKDLLDQETGLRGYLITGRGEYLQPFDDSFLAMQTNLISLRSLIATNYDKTTILTSIDNLRAKSRQWDEQAGSPEIAIRRELNLVGSNMSDVTSLIEKETGKNITDQIRTILATFIAVEMELMNSRELKADQAATTALFVVVIGTVIAIIIAIGVAMLVSNYVVEKLSILVTATNKFTRGDLNQIIEINTGDEFATLGLSFNEMTKTMKCSINEMEQATRAKGEFLANMSHEIRTPMNGVLGMLTILEQSGLSEKQESLVTTIRSCGDGLMVVINDILDLSKLESGKLEIEQHPFKLEDCIENSIYLLSSLSSQKGLLLTHDIGENIPESFLGDNIRIRQILMNLIGNAIKFTEFGDINISVAVTKQVNNIYYLCFSVKDAGIGISKVDQAKLFQPFSQVDASTTRKYGGTGLGLVICQKLVEQMQGEIGVNSSQGQGSTFYFTIPLQQIEFQQKEQKRRYSDIDNEMAKKLPLNILIVEDNHVNQIIAKNLLENFGYQPDLAENGKIALSAIARKSYDVVFMDMQMPVMDGIAATERIVDLYGSDRPRIIAMTANVFTADKEKCFAAGMDDFIGKPVVVEHVIAALLRCKNNTVNLQEVVGNISSVKSLSPIQKDQIIWDEEGFYRRVSNNEKLADRMMTMFHQDINLMAEELEQLITANDYDSIVTLGKKIKDLTDNIGALALKKHLEQLIVIAEAKQSLSKALLNFQQQKDTLMSVLVESFPQINKQSSISS